MSGRETIRRLALRIVDYADARVEALRGAIGLPAEHYLGLDLQPGAEHYRAYVGPPSHYDLIAATQFCLLAAVGLRENHYLLDVGCGSLRGGRLFIPYLLPQHYCGIEPNRWLVEEGIRREVGRSLVRLKQPRFMFNAEFDASGFGVSFDYMVAQSIFSHTYPDLAEAGLRQLGKNLAPGGILLATFGRWPHPSALDKASGRGWVYPGCVGFTESDVTTLVSAAGLSAVAIEWFHPWQAWFAIGRPAAEPDLLRLQRSLRRGFLSAT